MPDANGGAAAPEALLAPGGNEPQSSSSPITQAQSLHVSAPAADAPAPSTPRARRGGFITALLRCCGRVPDEGPEASPGTPSRTVYIPPAPHVGQPFIPPLQECDRGKKTLVLDLDETLVHSSFKPVPNPDYVIPVEIDGKITDVYVLKRPWVDHFMAEVGARFEVVVFTASLAKYADPLLDLLDRGGCVRWRLFRESCYPYEGNYVKDLTCLGRPLADTIIVDNSPHSYIFQPFNAVPIRNFIDDMSERDLLDLLPTLLSLADVEDVTTVIAETYLPGCTPVYGK